MLPHWQFNHHLTMHNEPLRTFISGFAKGAAIETDVNHSAKDAQFDQQENLKVVRITTVKERMLYDVTRFEEARPTGELSSSTPTPRRTT